LFHIFVKATLQVRIYYLHLEKALTSFQLFNNHWSYFGVLIGLFQPHNGLENSCYKTYVLHIFSQ